MVRYADGPTTEQSISIEAPVAAVWAIVSDPGFPAEHSKELQAADWAPDSAPPGVGAAIVGHNKHDAVGEWTTTSFVTEWNENQGWSWSVSDVDQPAAQWWFELAEIDGATTLTQRVRLGPGRSGLTPAIESMPDKEELIVERRLQWHDENMRANLEAAKARAEASNTG